MSFAIPFKLTMVALEHSRILCADLYFTVDGIDWDEGDPEYLQQEDITVSSFPLAAEFERLCI